MTQCEAMITCIRHTLSDAGHKAWLRVKYQVLRESPPGRQPIHDVVHMKGDRYGCVKDGKKEVQTQLTP